MSATVLVGDCLDVLRTLDAESVQTCVTSPPYFGLRDYGVVGQLGLEPTPDEYVAKLVDVFREVRRVLRPDATLWLNLGDSYTGSGKGGNPDAGKQATNRGSQTVGCLYGTGRTAREAAVTNVTRKNFDLGPKQLLGIPWRVAFALQAPYYAGRLARESDRGWLAALVDGEGCITILRAKSPHGSGDSYPPVLQVRMCDVEPIWHAAFLVGKGATIPRQAPPSHGGKRGSYQWRLNGSLAATICAELYPHLMVKRKQALVAWNHQRVRDSYETKRGVPIPAEALGKQQACRELIRALNRHEPVDIPSWMGEPKAPIEPGWYLRSDCIWHKPNPMPESVTDRPTRAHEYLFLLAKAERYYYDAEAIAEPSNGFNGSSFTSEYQAETKPGLGRGSRVERDTRNRRSVWTVATQPYSGAHFATFPPALIEPCILAGSKKGDTVLDPFGGAGTTGLAADRLGRNSILIELNPQYAEMARRRIVDDNPLFNAEGVA